MTSDIKGHIVVENSFLNDFFSLNAWAILIAKPPKSLHKITYPQNQVIKENPTCPIKNYLKYYSREEKKSVDLEKSGSINPHWKISILISVILLWPLRFFNSFLLFINALFISSSPLQRLAEFRLLWLVKTSASSSCSVDKS